MPTPRLLRAHCVLAVSLLLLFALAASSAPLTDLRLTKGASEETVRVGDTLTFTLTVQNGNEDLSFGTFVTDNLPPEFEFLSATTSKGACAEDGQEVTCDLGVLEFDEQVVVEIKVKALQAAVVTNEAVVTGTSPAFPDSNLDNNRGEVTVTILLPGSQQLDVGLEVEMPYLVKVGDTTKICIKVMPPDPQPADSFKNMEIFIGIQTVDSLFFGPPADTTVDLTRIGSSLADTERRRLSGKFGEDLINSCVALEVQCAKLELGDGFEFELEIFVDGFESGGTSIWTISAAADNSKKKTEKFPVGVLNEDKKLPVITEEDLKAAIELFNDDSLFTEKTIGLVSDSFGVLQQLPPHRGQYHFDEFESFRKDGSQAPVTVYGDNCPSPCSGLVMQGAGGSVNGIRFEGFPDYGLVLEADSLFITRSEFVGNGAGGVQITGGIGDILGNLQGLGNHFEANGGPGIVVEGGSGHAFKFNTFTDNGGLAIDLGGDGVTANDPGDVDTGPNDLQNFPVLNNVLLDASGTLVEGSLNSIAGTIYTLQFYANDACDDSGNGEGAVFLGETEVTTDANGDASFSLIVEGAATRGQFVTATATDPVSTSEFSACFEIVTGVATDDEAGVPTKFALDQNYPNPFNPATTIAYAVPEASQVRLEVFDLLGRLVVVLVDEMRSPGFYEVVFDASRLSSGVYFYKMTGEHFSQTKSLMLLK